jgi:hypothetical protein
MQRCLLIVYGVLHLLILTISQHTLLLPVWQHECTRRDLHWQAAQLVPFRQGVLVFNTDIQGRCLAEDLSCVRC